MESLMHDRIRQLAEGAGGQRQLAQRLNVDQSIVSRWCAGRTLPNARRLSRLVEVTRCDPGWLLMGDDFVHHSEPAATPPTGAAPDIPLDFLAANPAWAKAIAAIMMAFHQLGIPLPANSGSREPRVHPMKRPRQSSAATENREGDES